MTLAQVGRTSRTVFAGTETIGGIGLRRGWSSPNSDEQLSRSGSTLLRHDDRAAKHARVWIEGLPGSDEAAGALLDELARG